MPKNRILKKAEADILLAFVKAPWESLTFKQVKERTKKSSESYVFNTLKGFVKEGILTQERIGNNVLYHLHDSLKAHTYAGIVAEHAGWSKTHIPYDDIERIAKKIQGHFTLIITGSYAKNKQRKDSDLDIVIITENPKKVYAELRHECEMNIPKIHLFAFAKKEVLTMLAEDTSNYGKETVKNNLLLFGADAYFRIITTAIRHGFKG